MTRVYSLIPGAETDTQLYKDSIILRAESKVLKTIRVYKPELQENNLFETS